MMRNFFLGILILAPLMYACGAEQGETAVPKDGDNVAVNDPVSPTPVAKQVALHPPAGGFPWLDDYDSTQALARRIAPPEGAQRLAQDAGSFGAWLRSLPLKPGRPEVLLYNGQPKGYQGAHHAVFDIDVGRKDLQQCADAVMRLRAEYLLSSGAGDRISFNFTSGWPCTWAKWKEGYRPKISGSKVSWVKNASPGDSYAIFKKYMEMVYSYAGTASLEKELKPTDVAGIQPGDVFIWGGHPGHAVIVVDVAEDESGKRYFLLAQSYMPAQEIHVLRNPNDEVLSPWYPEDFGERLYTPEWDFDRSALRRFQ